MPATTRLIRLEDAARLAELQRAGREFLAPWEPARTEHDFTEDGQRRFVADALAQHRRGDALPHVVLDDDGEVVGRMTLSGIVLGVWCSANLGYWIAEHANGRGYATDGVRAMAAIGFGELGLHRIQAVTLRHNARSQRVLEKAGFEHIGMAPKYLRIAGRWQDHEMFQLLAHDRDVE
ncbi:GNAT family N-acetyltransferase [Agromyces sp. MMS24-K17]|uniref:GNAT family N-acetyltransferase n=1 Tax=Agromyces sp. MMS24-K17 TaxID=3372850 RepID=UPI003754422C